MWGIFEGVIEITYVSVAKNLMTFHGKVTPAESLSAQQRSLLNAISVLKISSFPNGKLDILETENDAQEMFVFK